MSPLTAAAVIATTATVMPTPLGGDNVAVATELAKYPAFAGMSVTDYVIQYHAMISVPTLIVMAVVHFFWQKFMDKKNTTAIADTVGDRTRKGNTGGRLVSFRIYASSNLPDSAADCGLYHPQCYWK